MSARTLTLTVVLAAAAIAGCKDDPKPTADDPSVHGRSETVKQTGAAATTSQPAAAHPVVPRVPRRLCDTPAAANRLPAGKLEHREAAGSTPLPDRFAASGKWMWINLWAAWCGPCKEEIPRLKAWEQRLAASMSVTFVSLDDDERQMTKFLESQPSNGLRASYWLPEGKARATFLSELRMKADPQLPQQVLVDPQGMVRCVIDGAVEDGDFAQVQAIVSKK
jgi:thiol-disulfide isomerase/thioredoxin